MSVKEKESVEDIIENTFKNIKNIVDANSIVGDVVQLTNNIVIVPISKIRVGIVSGGVSPDNKKNKNIQINMGSGSGFNIIPVGFIVVVGNDVRYINVNVENDSTNKMIDSLTNLCTEFLRSDKNEK